MGEVKIIYYGMEVQKQSRHILKEEGREENGAARDHPRMDIVAELLQEGNLKGDRWVS